MPLWVGIAGFFCLKMRATLSNIYSRFTLQGTIMGGFLAKVAYQGYPVVFSNCYSSSVFLSSSIFKCSGSVFGLSSSAPSSLYFMQVYFNTDNNPSAFGSVSPNPSDGIDPHGLKCAQLWHSVNDTFSHTIWGGDRLLSMGTLMVIAAVNQHSNNKYSNKKHTNKHSNNKHSNNKSRLLSYLHYKRNWILLSDDLAAHTTPIMVESKPYKSDHNPISLTLYLQHHSCCKYIMGDTTSEHLSSVFSGAQIYSKGLDIYTSKAIL